ncbi:MAG TPA: hypothetical protein VD963_08605 [Phycisphaerales bacterium]|nr:hypothetical protein [Phycisphaerales bacterium]
MEQRQTQVRVGAGLEESRLNKDFIEFLQRWGWLILAILVVVLGGYIGLRELREYRVRQTDQAFEALTSAAAAGNPDNLLRVAEEFSGQPGVPHLARLSAGDIYLRAYRSGLAPGVQQQPDGTLSDPEGALTEEQRKEMLGKARAAYEAALAGSRGDRAATIHEINAHLGLAAAAESADDLEAARAHYASALELATRAQLGHLAELARLRQETLASLPPRPVLLTRADLPPEPASAPPPPAAGPTIMDTSGNPIQMTPIEGPPPGMGFPGAPAPAPAPPPSPAQPPSEPGPASGPEQPNEDR